MNFRNLLFACVLFSQISNYLCKPASKRVSLGQMGVLDGFEHKRAKRRGVFGPARDHCLSATASVNLENGITVAMSELQIGDRVQAGDSLSEIRTILKQQPTVRILYKSITTNMNKTISLSGNHLIFSRTSNIFKFLPVYAEDVSVNDELLVQGSNNLIPSKVIKVSNSVMQGAYVPLTMKGSIIVDGVLASCYPSVDHDLSHIGMTPIRWFPEIIEWIFGDDNGWQNYVKLAEDVGLVVPYSNQY